ncbi:hypothetical protein RRG08_001738 [Elysia crispata]|uniref:Uncharacterized protein n=1 Tax=Elysia crispata TaxID=231223 RepID=A0AAE1AK35_9GAST|nr:hypothetical protein RRG08_001738 [Elysia crispata]
MTGRMSSEGPNTEGSGGGRGFQEVGEEGSGPEVVGGVRGEDKRSHISHMPSFYLDMFMSFSPAMTGMHTGC